jgi:mannose-6-phosphate isomerase-like protein (cupin superfamily)
MDAVEVFKFEGPLLDVIQKTDLTQVAVMTIPPDGNSGDMEINENSDLTILVLRGKARVKVGSEENTFTPGTSIIVPVGVNSFITNTGDKPLFIYLVSTTAL